jgi:5-methylcytosine-specific restriction endonuclease McrA
MVVSPILDFTAKHGFSNNSNMGSSYYNHPVASMPQVRPNAYSVGGAPKATKRSVSETKKKFVAASQNWHCGKCARQLPAWFEVDHKVRLEYGGSNQVDNLVALCRDCHGEKTALENL